VTVTGEDDGEADGNVVYAVVTAPATSTDPGYSGLDPDTPTVLPDLAVPGKVTVYTDKTSYGMSDVVTGTVHNGTSHSVFLPGCGIFDREYEEQGAWVNKGPSVICGWEGEAVEVKPGASHSQEAPASIASRAETQAPNSKASQAPLAVARPVQFHAAVSRKPPMTAIAKPKDISCACHCRVVMPARSGCQPWRYIASQASMARMA